MVEITLGVHTQVLCAPRLLGERLEVHIEWGYMCRGDGPVTADWCNADRRRICLVYGNTVRVHASAVEQGYGPFFVAWGLTRWLNTRLTWPGVKRRRIADATLSAVARAALAAEPEAASDALAALAAGMHDGPRATFGRAKGGARCVRN